MPSGIEIYDNQGRLTMDLTIRISRLLGSVQTGQAAGSLSTGDFQMGTPYWFTPSSSDNFSTNGPLKKDISITGTTLTWTDGAPVTIFYGVY
jgi:hypothetical protein